MQPAIDIHSAGVLSAERRDEIEQWFHMQFAHTSFQWSAPAWHVLGCVGDRLVGYLRMFERVISAGGHAVRVGGIGGVMTRPECRRRGIASALLRRAAQFIGDELGAEFGLLLCREEVAPVYAKLGWQIVAGPTTFEQPSGKATYPRLTMVLPFTEKEWPAGPIDMCGLPW